MLTHKHRGQTWQLARKQTVTNYSCPKINAAVRFAALHMRFGKWRKWRVWIHSSLGYPLLIQPFPSKYPRTLLWGACRHLCFNAVCISMFLSTQESEGNVKGWLMSAGREDHQGLGSVLVSRWGTVGCRGARWPATSFLREHGQSATQNR